MKLIAFLLAMAMLLSCESLPESDHIPETAPDNQNSWLDYFCGRPANICLPQCEDLRGQKCA